MYLQHLFRSFQPLHNTIGFGAADFVVATLAILLTALLGLRALAAPLLRRLAEQEGRAVAALFGVGVALRLLLLPAAPVPAGAGADDFSYLLLGDTLRHGSLANPAHPMHRFFETNFVLQEPTYSSIYPLGQGLVLAIGKLCSGSFWTGVLVSEALFCGLVYWALAGWISRNWALVGGLLAVMQFGPLDPWMNSYWGGAVSGCAGCLVFGALPRISRDPRCGWLLGLGLGLELLTRPFEFLLLSACAALYWVMRLDIRPRRPALAQAASLVLLAGALAACQNRAVTQSWTTLPYALSRYQYGVPATFTFQASPEPHRVLTAEQELGYRAQAAIHGSRPDSATRFVDRLVERVRFLRFFWAAPLYVAAFFFLPKLRSKRGAFVGGALLLFALGTNFYPYFYPHYAAAAACLLTLVAVMGLERLNRISAGAAQTILLLCAAQFLFWYGVNGSGDENLASVTRYESWDYLNRGDPEGRLAVNERLAREPGEQLVFIRYAPRHRFQEWIHNEARIDEARVVWAADLGVEEDAQLRRYYPKRTSWILEPDAAPPKLSRMDAR